MIHEQTKLVSHTRVAEPIYKDLIGSHIMEQCRDNNAHVEQLVRRKLEHEQRNEDGTT